MTITEVSQIYDISQDTLRYYERVGLIPHVNRTKGGVRNYTEDMKNTLDRLNYKIDKYEQAEVTGVLSWDDDKREV